MQKVVISFIIGLVLGSGVVAGVAFYFNAGAESRHLDDLRRSAKLIADARGELRVLQDDYTRIGIKLEQSQARLDASNRGLEELKRFLGNGVAEIDRSKSGIERIRKIISELPRYRYD